MELVKQGLVGLPEVVTALPQGRDGEVTYAYTVPPEPPSETITTRVYYDTVVCRTPDVEHLPRRRHRADAAAGPLSPGDDHVLEELARAAAGSPVDVPPVARSIVSPARSRISG